MNPLFDDDGMDEQSSVDRFGEQCHKGSDREQQAPRDPGSRRPRAERQQAPADESGYDPYGIRPPPDAIPFEEPVMTIVWGSSDPGGELPHRCTCGADLPPGRWIEQDPVGFVDDAARYPVVDPPEDAKE